MAADGPRYPAIVARLGADTYAFVQDWLAWLEQELDTKPGLGIHEEWLT